MDQEVKKELEEIKAKVLENNVMLGKILFHNKIAVWSKIAYWVIIILITVGAFAVIKPLMGSLGQIYAPNGIGDSLKTIGSPDNIKELQNELSQ